jgi:hypothetical protein
MSIEAFVDRFWQYVERKGPEECWEWAGSKDRLGYGQFWADGKPRRAHRIAYMLHNGTPEDDCICHSCDNRACCNPNHLWEGSQADNMKDRFQKGRIKVNVIE